MKYPFEPLGAYGDIHFNYSAPAQADIIKTTADFDGFKALLDLHTHHPWIWIFDCRGMKATHYTNVRIVQRLATLLETEHASSLKGVWIINVNTWMQTVLKLFCPAKVQVLPTDRLELFVHLQKSRCPTPLMDRMLMQ